MINDGAINNNATIDALNDVKTTLTNSINDVNTTLTNNVNTTKNNLQSQINQNTPVGTIIARGSSTTPTGYLACNGSNVSRTTYSALFTVIGTRFGSGDGSTTFTLPNLSSARMVTSSTISVKGTGKTLGLTDGTLNVGIDTISTDNALRNRTNSYGTNVGTTTNTNSSTSGNKTLGITTDASKSGITGTASLAQDIDYFIKY